MFSEAIVGSAVFMLVLFWRRADIHLVVDAPGWVRISLGICLLGGLYLLGRGRWAAFFGLRHLSSYPPPWIASLLGVGAMSIAGGFLSVLRTDLGMEEVPAAWCCVIGVTCLGSVGLLALISGFWNWCSSRRRPPRQKMRRAASPNVQSFSSFSRLREWLQDDAPVLVASDDVFGYARIAERMAGRLVEPRAPAQAVVGALGAGKTTLRFLVQQAVRDGSAGTDVRLVPVELWPFENPRAAVEGVIRALIEALAREVNVVALQGLPASYVEAMSAAGGAWAALLRLQGVPSNPFDALRLIDETAITIGLRYVVWIEDLERFAVGEDSAVADERLNPIRALLFGLDQLGSVSVITATTTLRMRFDIEKIARYVEELPRLSDGQVRSILGMFRTGCREGGSIIDPADPNVRKALDDLGSVEGIAMFRAMFGSKIVDIKDSLVALCSTPRALKQALRSCLDVWNRLSGEIDFDDVLVLSVLRESSPEAFALVQEHVDDFRREESGRSDDRKEFGRTWNEVLGSLKGSARTGTAIGSVVEFVFNAERRRQNPQGLMNRNHVDYWERFLSVPLLSADERDQPVLTTMRQNDDQALLDIVQDVRRSTGVEDFEHLLGLERIVGLLEPLVERRSRECSDVWHESVPPGLIPLWRLWNRRFRSGELTQDVALRTLLKALDVAVPRNLALASALEHYFVVAGEGVPRLVGDPGRNEAKAHLRRLMVTTYTGNEVALGKALQGAEPPTLLWLCWGLDRVRSRQMADLPFEGWPEFAKTVLAAARIQPRVMLPQIAGLITKASDVSFVFDADQTERLFGDVRSVLRLFENENAANWIGIPYFAAVSSAAEEAARTENSPDSATQGR